MSHRNARRFARLHDDLSARLAREAWTEERWRREYAPLLEARLAALGPVRNDLRAGSHREIEVFRKAAG